MYLFKNHKKISFIIIFIALFCFIALPVWAFSKSYSVNDFKSLLKTQLEKKLYCESLEIELTPIKEKKKIKNELNSISINTNNANIDGIYIPSAEIKTVDSPIKFNQENKRLILINTIKTELSGYLSETSINKSLKLEKFRKLLTNIKIKIDNQNYLLINFTNPYVDIQTDKILFYANLYVQGMPSFLQFPITIQSGIKTTSSQIFLKDLSIVGVNIDSLSKAINKKEILLYDFNKLYEKEKINATIHDISIKNDKIEIKGNVIIPKNSKKYSLKME